MLLIDKDRTGDISISQFSSELLEGEIVEPSGENISILFVDVETTGLSYDNDKIIQLACRPVLVDKATGSLTRVMGNKIFFNDPGFPISKEISDLTGVTDQDVKGKSVDWISLAKIMNRVDFVVAHNVRFDRHFIKKHMIESGVVMPETIWGCTMSQIDWRKVCTAGRSLETLSAWHGFYYSAHDAGVDVDAMIYLLARSGFVNELLENALKSQYRVFACNFPRNKNDELKSRKYRWDPDVRMWWTGFDNKESADEEVDWLKQTSGVEPQIFEVKPNHLFD